MIVHDITMPMDAGMPLWPGDTAFEYACPSTQAAGAIANTGRIATSLHAGTHADAPKHLDAGAATIGQMDPAIFVGPAIVVDVSGMAVIGPEYLRAHDLAWAPRVLMITRAWADRGSLPGSWPALSPDLPPFLAARGVVLLGVDVPSVDPPDSTVLAIHRDLIAHGIAIIESLVLDRVAPGRYDLCALPLALADGDGSPVRAVLIER